MNFGLHGAKPASASGIANAYSRSSATPSTVAQPSRHIASTITLTTAKDRRFRPAERSGRAQSPAQDQHRQERSGNDDQLAPDDHPAAEDQRRAAHADRACDDHQRERVPGRGVRPRRRQIVGADRSGELEQGSLERRRRRSDRRHALPVLSTTSLAAPFAHPISTGPFLLHITRDRSRRRASSIDRRSVDSRRRP